MDNVRECYTIINSIRKHRNKFLHVSNDSPVNLTVIKEFYLNAGKRKQWTSMEFTPNNYIKLKRLYRLKDKDLKISCGTTKCWTGFYSSAYQSHKSVQKSKSTHDHDTVRNLLKK
jgi:hypothetical protein